MTGQTSSLNIVIFGIGAMGTLFGSRLSPLATVTLFGHWAEQIKTLRRNGLTVTHIDGRQSRHALRVIDKLDKLPTADIALILVKSYQTGRAAGEAAAILHPKGLAITLQNGLGNLETLAQAVGQQRAGIGVTAQGATVLAPGQVRHAGAGPTHLALRPGQVDKITQVAELFNLAELETHLVEHPDSLIWGKLAVNAGINPLTALLEAPNGLLAEYEKLKSVMSAAANEVAGVASALNIHLPFADAAQRALEVCQATASNYSSMLQDIRRGAPTEIDAICGAVVRLGQQAGIPTPVNELLWQLVKEKEAGRLAINAQRLNLETFELAVLQQYLG